ncbi:GPR1/FUN34/YaaH-class plasma membrane protein-like protein [Aureobasidium pullulans]|nr:GPR1/FUN34/YaaH-class plasma membrane protein-like protein [Aureobasidium pullulans]
MANEANYNGANDHLNHLASPPLEKDFSHDYHNNNNIGNDVDSETALQRIRTAGSISISPELFEKIYLSPQNKVAGELRKTFGNPTPLALVGFLLSLTPLSCMLMGWRGASNTGAADIGAYFFFGGLLMILGSIGEWLIGNTFPFVVFGSFGAFWLTFAATLQPFYNAYGAFSPDATAPGEGLATVEFNASFGFFLVFMGMLCLLYFICSLRTNVVFAMIFFTLVLAFGCLTGAYWNLAIAYGNPATSAARAAHAATATRCLVAAGALTFVTDMCGWWIFFAIMLAALDFPFQLPVGDLSTFIKGASDRKKAKEEKERYNA